MAVGREILGKITSLKNTQKITKAMEMVAASKMRKVQDRMRESIPYAQKIIKIMERVTSAHSEYPHPFLVERKVKRVGMIIISSDRGLCGGLNISLFRTCLRKMRELEKQGCEVDLAIFGRKGVQFMNASGAHILAQTTQLGDSPGVDDLTAVAGVMKNAYMDKKIDQVLICGNRFINTVSQKPYIDKLIPVEVPATARAQPSHYWDYIYEPDAVELIDALAQRYIDSVTFRSVVENIACEQAARMVAMKAATDNASNLVDELQLVYNKARQASITQEISEIVGGAAAI